MLLPLHRLGPASHRHRRLFHTSLEFGKASPAASIDSTLFRVNCGHSASRLCGAYHPFRSALHRLRLLWPLLTSRSAVFPRRRPFRRKARSPQVRYVTFPAQPPDLRRLTLGCWSFAVVCPLAPVGTASYPVSVRQLAVSLPASFSADLAVGPVARLVALRFARGRCNLLPQRTFTSKPRPCWAHKRKSPGIAPRAFSK